MIGLFISAEKKFHVFPRGASFRTSKITLMLTGAYGGAVNYINYGITVIPCHGITVITSLRPVIVPMVHGHNHWIVDCGLLCPWTMGTITGQRLWYGVNHNNYNHWTSPRIERIMFHLSIHAWYHR